MTISGDGIVCQTFAKPSSLCDPMFSLPNDFRGWFSSLLISDIFASLLKLSDLTGGSFVGGDVNRKLSIYGAE